MNIMYIMNLKDDCECIYWILKMYIAKYYIKKVTIKNK